MEVETEVKIKKFKCLYTRMPQGNDKGMGPTMSLNQTIEAASYEVRGNTIVFLDGPLGQRPMGENVIAKLPNKDLWEITEI